MPGKRFVKQTVVQKSKTYVGREFSYRRCVRHDGLPIMYDGPGPADADEPRSLAPSTVWRWLSWLGSLPKTVRAAGRLIRRKESGCTLHREPWALSPQKYRSQKRRHTLTGAMQLIATARLFETLFEKPMFPHLATAHGWS